VINDPEYAAISTQPTDLHRHPHAIAEVNLHLTGINTETPLSWTNKLPILVLFNWA
jgi:hypothetical protein